MLCHRDYHSRNLMVHDGSLYIIDFQDARMGPDTYDLVSLLRDSYVDLTDRELDELIAYFLALKRRRRRADADEFRRRFDLMALQRNLKALGTFGYQTTTRRNPVYIQYIPRTLRYVARQPREVSAVRPAARAAGDATSRNCGRALHADPGATAVRPCGNAVRDFDASLPRPAAGRDASARDRGARLRSGRAVSRRGRISTITTRSAVADLQQWLAEAGLELHGVHAPVSESFAADAGVRCRSPSADANARARRSTKRSRRCTSRGGFRCRCWSCTWAAATHAGPATTAATPRGAASRSCAALAEPLGVRIAVEVIPNELSRAGSLVHFVEEDLEAADVGICLDFGHAHIDGDLVDAIETVSEHLIDDARARQPRTARRSSACRSTAPSTGRRR